MFDITNLLFDILSKIILRCEILINISRYFYNERNIAIFQIFHDKVNVQLHHT